MKIISITIAMILLSGPALAMGAGDAMKASNEPGQPPHGASGPVSHSQPAHHPAAVHHKHKKPG